MKPARSHSDPSRIAGRIGGQIGGQIGKPWLGFRENRSGKQVLDCSAGLPSPDALPTQTRTESRATGRVCLRHVSCPGYQIRSISRSYLTVAIASAQDLAQHVCAVSIFAAGHFLEDTAHQVRVVNAPPMDPFRQKANDGLDMTFLSVMYPGRRHVNQRQWRDERDLRRPTDLAAVSVLPLAGLIDRAPSPRAFHAVFVGTARASVTVGVGIVGAASCSAGPILCWPGPQLARSSGCRG